MRVFVVILALVLGLAGLAMSLCGGGFLIAELSEGKLFRADYGVGFIAVFALVIGAVLVWAAVKILSSTKGAPAATRGNGPSPGSPPSTPPTPPAA